MKLRLVMYLFFLLAVVVGLSAVFFPQGRVFIYFSTDGQIGPTGVNVIRFSGILLAGAGLLGILGVWQRQRLKSVVDYTVTAVEGMSSTKWIVLIIALSFLLRLAWIIYIPALPVSDFVQHYNLAEDLSAGLGYGYPEPTAYRPVGYPAFLALLFHIFGVNLFIAKFFQVIFSVLICVLVYFVAREAGASEMVSRIASLVIAVYPPHIFFTSLMATEPMFTVFLLLAILTLFKGLKQERLWFFILCGVCSGVGVLIRPQALFLPALLALVLVILRRHKFAKFLPGALAIIVMAGLTTLPWQARNYRIWGRWGVIAHTGGITFFHANNPGRLVKGYLLQEKWRDAGYNAQEIDRMFYQAGIESIKNDPGWVANNIIRWKFRRYFSFTDFAWLAQYNLARTSRELRHSHLVYHSIIISSAISYTLIFLLGIYGLFKSRLGNHFKLLFGALFLYWLLAVAAFHGAPRFRYPLIPLFVFFTAAGIAKIWAKFNSRNGTVGQDTISENASPR